MPKSSHAGTKRGSDQKMIAEAPWLAHPSTGNYLTIAAAVSLQFTVIMVPLVGPAGSVAPHAQQNFMTFLSMALLTILLSGSALASRLQRRQWDGSPLPLWTFGLLGVSLFMLFALFTGAFEV